MGLLLTDLRADFAVTRLRRLAPETLPEMVAAFHDLDARAKAWFDDEAIAPKNRRTARTVDMRYAGQNYELAVVLPEGDLSPRSLAALAEGFAAEHQRLYGFTADDEPVQLVTFRLAATGLVPKASLTPCSITGSDGTQALIEQRPIWLDDSATTLCPVYERERLEAGDRFQGPAIVEQMDATTFVPAGIVAQVDVWLNLILEAA
jgi:N-methylhydantoinase A